MPRFTKRKNNKNKFTRKYKGNSKRGLKYGGIKYRRGGAAASVSAAKLPMIIDQNQVTYTCTPVPTS